MAILNTPPRQLPFSSAPTVAPWAGDFGKQSPSLSSPGEKEEVGHTKEG